MEVTLSFLVGLTESGAGIPGVIGKAGEASAGKTKTPFTEVFLVFFDNIAHS